jgi:drug/metabolite transporter (DMT)-like permease
VQPGRAHATYESAAQILFWCVFGGMIVVVLAQIALFVSFGNRRPNVRWWLFATLFLQGVVLIFAHEFLAFGDRGRPLELLLAGQYAFVILALLLSLLPPALRWSARRYDIRRGEA